MPTETKDKYNAFPNYLLPYNRKSFFPKAVWVHICLCEQAKKVRKGFFIRVDWPKDGGFNGLMRELCQEVDCTDVKPQASWSRQGYNGYGLLHVRQWDHLAKLAKGLKKYTFPARLATAAELVQTLKLERKSPPHFFKTLF